MASQNMNYNKMISYPKLKSYKEEQLDMSSTTRKTDLVSATCSRDSNGDRPLANRRKDARLMMMYKIDRELVSITKENRLIPPCRRFRNTHNRVFQLESCCIDTFSQEQWGIGICCHQTLWSWTHLKPLRPGLCPFSRQADPTCIYNCK